MMVCLLRGLRHAVDEPHGLREVAELPIADDLVALASSVALAQALVDLWVAQQLCHIVPPVRIVSLVPSATEMLFALGLGPDLIAVTHECDYPPAALELPKVTRDVLPPGLSSAEIDAAVKDLTPHGQSTPALATDDLPDRR